ncbi:MAG TPA: malto-oligosyltrehalose synthase [Alphaproteobacteria bacterium]|nr:malto-oligosyltrehalose synthase [Alphaproteobacteria bacterium]
MSDPPPIPLATYRLQFNKNFTFDDATAIVPYLNALGISHIYASPYLKARPGSTHGYDIIDHNALNPEIGTPESFTRLCRTLREHGMGQVVDFVPNHMGVGKTDNEWWLDVLEWGEASPFSDFFDIDWTASRRNFPGKVLLPSLGDQYGRVLERGELQLKFDRFYGGFSIWYFDNRFPIRLRDYATIMRRRLSEVSLPRPDADAADLLERFAGDFAAIGSTRRAAIRSGEARDRAARLKADLSRLTTDDDAINRLLEEGASLFNGTAGQPETFVRLHNLLERQFYRIAYWRTAADEINYRRFFEINDLAGIRPENPKVFTAIHGLLKRLIAEGAVHGIRLDHIDGLFDPAAYCRALQALARSVAPHGDGGKDKPFYLVVEKILAPHESVRRGWPIHGTSGYDFLNIVNGVLVDPAGEAALSEIYDRMTRTSHDFDEIAYACKKHIIDTALASELAVLANQLDRITEQDWRVRDFTRFRLRDALKEIVACFPVYRTYITRGEVAKDDERDIDTAIKGAKSRWQAPDPEIFDFLRDVLLGRWQAPLGIPRRIGVVRFAMRFQQYTGPVTAKSIEDTAFYRYHRLISLNEVGGDPKQFGLSVAAFHRLNEARVRDWPHAMLASATHDTKRGEDARARIDVLSELAPAWGARVERWVEINRARASEVDGRRAPSRNDEYLMYQTLLGVWPAEWTGRRPEPGEALERFKDRLRGYLVKALREAKMASSWARPNEPLEEACVAFLTTLVDPAQAPDFLDDFLPFQATVARFGMLNSLVQVALKLTCPGIPDIYQGCEKWDLSLVDPDNRRPVDFADRHAGLNGADNDWAALLEDWPTGKVKLALTHRLLRLRQELPDVFTSGGYKPVESGGARADHIIAYARRHRGREIAVVIGRFFAKLSNGAPESYSAASWQDTWIALPDGERTDSLSGRTICPRGGKIGVSDLFRALPVAVLVSGD